MDFREKYIEYRKKGDLQGIVELYLRRENKYNDENLHIISEVGFYMPTAAKQVYDDLIKRLDRELSVTMIQTNKKILDII